MPDPASPLRPKNVPERSVTADAAARSGLGGVAAAPVLAAAAAFTLGSVLFVVAVWLLLG